MRTAVLAIVLAIFMIGCGGQALVSQRYQAERDLWNCNRELQHLFVRPELVTQERWLALADQFEVLGSGSTPIDRATDNPDDIDQINNVRARALVTAAKIHSALKDSTRMMELYDLVHREFSEVPIIVAEIAWARGQIAEKNGNLARAADEYQDVVDRIAPDVVGAKMSKVVMELPMRIALLRTRAGQDSASVPPHDVAGEYYKTIIRDFPDSKLELEARYFLASLAADRGQWTQAISDLRYLEQRLLETESPPRNPAEIRFLTGLIQRQGNAPPDSSLVTFASLLKDYPLDPLAPKSLQLMSAISAEHGQIEAALEYLDRIPDEYPGAENSAAEAMLTKGRLLEQNELWPESLAILRALPRTYPLSEPALLAPLEIVAHDMRRDTGRMSRDLERAEREYREFVSRYPSGNLTFSAREKLVRVLFLQERYGEAVAELTSLAEALNGTREGAGYMVNAANMAFSALQDTVQAAELLDRAGTLYADTDIGRWASAEASRLKKEME